MTCQGPRDVFSDSLRTWRIGWRPGRYRFQVTPRAAEAPVVGDQDPSAGASKAGEAPPLCSTRSRKLGESPAMLPKAWVSNPIGSPLGRLCGGPPRPHIATEDRAQTACSLTSSLGDCGGAHFLDVGRTSHGQVLASTLRNPWHTQQHKMCPDLPRLLSPSCARLGLLGGLASSYPVPAAQT